MNRKIWVVKMDVYWMYITIDGERGDEAVEVGLGLSSSFALSEFLDLST